MKRLLVVLLVVVGLWLAVATPVLAATVTTPRGPFSSIPFSIPPALTAAAIDNSPVLGE